MNTDSQWSKQEACFACVTRLWIAINHNTSVTSDELVRRLKLLHGPMSLAAVNQICVNHEATKGCENLKIH